MKNKSRIFDSSDLDEVSLRKLICKAAKMFGVSRVVFNNKAKYVRGTYNCSTGVLFLDTKQEKTEMLGTFFHELGHHFAVKNKRWKAYHFDLVPSMKVDRIFNIENKVDGYAKKLWNKHVNSKQWGKYKYCYPKSQKTAIMNTLFNR